MKNLIGITCYPINKMQIEMLHDCIDSLSVLGWDIMVLSHYPVGVDIQKKVNYVHYDSRNDLLPPEMNQHNFLSTDGFSSKVFNGGHALAISRNLNSLFSLGDLMGYDFCLCVEFDCFFSSDDLSKIPDLIDEMVSKQRKALVFNPQSHHVSSCNYEEIGPYYCETCFFISEPKFFLNSFAPPKDLSEWMNNHMCYTLEISLFDKLKNYPDLVEFKDFYTSDYFSSSRMNQHRYGLFNCDFIYNQNSPDVPILLINNIYHDRYKVEVFKDNAHISTIESYYPGNWAYLPFEFDGSLVRTVIYKNDEYLEEKEFLLDRKNLGGHQKKGVIDFYS